MNEDIQKQYETWLERSERIISEATFPPDPEEGTYTNRNLEGCVVERVEEQDGRFYVTAGWTFGIPKEVADLLPPGKEFVSETVQGSLVTGFLIDGVWYIRKSDAQLAEERRVMLEGFERQRQENYEQNKDRWQEMEDSLPDWLKARLQTFHEKGGAKFKVDGWGYEVIVCKLAELYADMGDSIRDQDQFSVVDSEEVKAFSREEGTSGNQHGMALALAKRHLAYPEETMAGTVSALAPLTGSAFYEE